MIVEWLILPAMHLDFSIHPSRKEQNLAVVWSVSLGVVLGNRKGTVHNVNQLDAKCHHCYSLAHT